MLILLIISGFVVLTYIFLIHFVHVKGNSVWNPLKSTGANLFYTQYMYECLWFGGLEALWQYNTIIYTNKVLVKTYNITASARLVCMVSKNTESDNTVHVVLFQQTTKKWQCLSHSGVRKTVVYLTQIADLSIKVLPKHGITYNITCINVTQTVHVHVHIILI